MFAPNGPLRYVQGIKSAPVPTKKMSLAGPGIDTTRDEYGNTVLLNGV
jgi:hypothetical protein